MNFEQAVDYIVNIPRFSNGPNGQNKSGKENLANVMRILGNPHLVCDSIHIAGTNGKGSTARFIMSMLANMGYKVGVFTSPHLEKINERIVVEDKNISDDEFLDAFMQVKAAIEENITNGGSGLSFFEYMFAIGTVHFSKCDLDYVIYETGLGGRLDATNILEPKLSVITSIGLDHTEYLGNTVELIAGEKAGIVKPGVPVVYNTGDELADKVIHETAVRLGCREINVAKTPYIINDFTDKTIDFSMGSSYYKYRNLKINVGAAYQVNNAMTAICSCHVLLGIMPDTDIVQGGLDKFSWPGRMEWLNNKVIVDGAHNLNAIERFVETVKNLEHRFRIHILFAVAGDKKYELMIDRLCEKLDISSVWVTAINSSRGVSVKDIESLFIQSLNKYQRKCEVCGNSDIKDTFVEAYNRVKDTEDLLICVGSLYLIGSIKEISKEVLND